MKQSYDKYLISFAITLDDCSIVKLVEMVDIRDLNVLKYMLAELEDKFLTIEINHSYLFIQACRLLGIIEDNIRPLSKTRIKDIEWLGLPTEPLFFRQLMKEINKEST